MRFAPIQQRYNPARIIEQPAELKPPKSCSLLTVNDLCLDFTHGTAMQSRIQVANAVRHLSSAAFEGATELADEGAGEELVAEQLRRAATGLGKLTGRVDVEDILDVIFREFCVGK
jgi:tRNA U34 5-carboxymethylaminomethyl modifying GTPase MnmE/TrmE